LTSWKHKGKALRGLKSSGTKSPEIIRNVSKSIIIQEYGHKYQHKHQRELKMVVSMLA
jgi:hypothetical protein